MIRLALRVSLLMLGPAAAAQTTLFVNASLTTGNDDGSSWSNAFQGPTGLLSAIQAASSGDRIFVAHGTYLPAPPGGSVLSSFSIGTDCHLFGGFVGGETSPEERPQPIVLPSVLSGDLQGDDVPGTLLNRSDNCKSVVRVVVSGSAGPTLDGFTISGGTGEMGLGPGSGAGLWIDGAALVQRCVFSENHAVTHGGGIALSDFGTLDAFDCVFRGNSAQFAGGGLWARSSSRLSIRRCRFEGNEATRGAGLWAFFGQETSLESCVFSANVASAEGGAAVLAGQGVRAVGLTVVGNISTGSPFGGIARGSFPSASSFLSSSILWGNAGVNGNVGSESQVQPGPTVTHSIVEGITPGANGNLDTAPSFVDVANGDFRLAPGSPGIDAGDSRPFLYLWNRDIEGKSRFVDDPSTADTGVRSGPVDDYPVVDMGAHEFAADTVGAPACIVAPNSLGRRAHLRGFGSDEVAVNDLTLEAWNLPPGQFTLLVVSATPATVPFSSGSDGVLCLGGDIGRYVAQLAPASATGDVAVPIDLSSIPVPGGPVAAMPGDRWFFQAWYRDGAGGVPASNFTGALEVNLR